MEGLGLRELGGSCAGPRMAVASGFSGGDFLIF